jgi:hypothetical protein
MQDLAPRRALARHAACLLAAAALLAACGASGNFNPVATMQECDIPIGGSNINNASGCMSVGGQLHMNRDYQVR